MQIPITMAAAVLVAVLVACIIITCRLLHNATYAFSRREDYMRAQKERLEQDVADLTITLDNVNSRYRELQHESTKWQQAAEYHQAQVRAVIAELEELQAECAADAHGAGVSNLEKGSDHGK